MGRTVVCWDIDNTINVHGRVARWTGEWLSRSVTRTEVPALFEGLPEIFNAFDLRVSKVLLDSIVSLQFFPDVENMWLTAWEQDARTVFSVKMGFTHGEEWFSFSSPAGSFSLDAVEGWWKTAVVREFLKSNPDDRLIWIDDLLDSEETVEAANRLLVEEFEGRIALVGVPPYIGVTPDSFAFVKRLATEKWQSGMFLFEG